MGILVLLGTVVLVTVFALVRYLWRNLVKDPTPTGSVTKAKGPARVMLAKKEYEEARRLRRRMISDAAGTEHGIPRLLADLPGCSHSALRADDSTASRTAELMAAVGA